jgi:hypothetical protein
MWGALCREFLGWSRLRRGASPEPLTESFGFTLGQAIEDLRALAERDHASRDLRRTAQLLATLVARGRAGERTVLVAEPLRAAVDAAVVVFHGGEEPIICRAGWLASALAGAAPCCDIGFHAMLSGYFFGSVTAFGSPPGGSAFGLIETPRPVVTALRPTPV